MRLEIPEATPSGNPFLRMHWGRRKRLQERWCKQIWAAVYQFGYRQPAQPPQGKMKVTITRISPRQLDKDNLYAGAKPVVDSLRACRLIADDTPDHIDLVVRQEKGRAGTVIEVEAA